MLKQAVLFVLNLRTEYNRIVWLCIIGAGERAGIVEMRRRQGTQCFGQLRTVTTLTSSELANTAVFVCLVSIARAQAANDLPPFDNLRFGGAITVNVVSAVSRAALGV